jgi:hypothetical protein
MQQTKQQKTSKKPRPAPQDPLQLWLVLLLTDFLTIDQSARLFMTKTQFQPLLKKSKQTFYSIYSSYQDCLMRPIPQQILVDVNERLEQSLWEIFVAILKTRTFRKETIKDILDNHIQGGLVENATLNWKHFQLYVLKGSRMMKNTDPSFWKILKLCWKQFERIFNHLKTLFNMSKQSIQLAESKLKIITLFGKINESFSFFSGSSSVVPYQIPSLRLDQQQDIRRTQRQYQQQEQQQMAQINRSAQQHNTRYMMSL